MNDAAVRKVLKIGGRHQLALCQLRTEQGKPRSTVSEDEGLRRIRAGAFPQAPTALLMQAAAVIALLPLPGHAHVVVVAEHDLDAQ